ncbi:MAG: hypothetical protein AAF968_05280 [Pseudomonadota bacterium]
MSDLHRQDGPDPRQTARESFSGKGLTDAQFEEAWAIAAILKTEIARSGSFREKLTDYAHVYARAEKFDALRGETILRDIFTARFGQSLNQARTVLTEREKALPETAKDQAYRQAQTVCDRIREGQTQPFYQAYGGEAVTLARDLGISQVGAKKLMKDAYDAKEGRDLYEVGKSLEETYHRPVRNAEIAARKLDQSKAQDPARTRRRD